jgi:hypothetical protein
MKQFLTSQLILLLSFLLAACTTRSQAPTPLPAIETPVSVTQSSLLTPTGNSSTEVLSTQVTQGIPTIEYQAPSTVSPAPSTMTSEIDKAVSPTITDDLGGSISGPLGNIYVDDSVVYGYLDPSAGFQAAISPIAPESPDKVGPTNKAISLAFSYYSQQVAYITNDSGELRLWIGDLNLDEVELIWADHQKWLKYDPDNYDVIAIQWRLNDKFIILVNRSNIVLIGLDDKLETRLSGTCNWLGISPKTGHFSVWCPLVSETEGYMVFEKDGSFWSTPSLPKDHYLVSDWVFSPSGDRVLYATEQGDLIIVGENIKQLVLPITYAPPRWDITMRVLQWSQDGSHILIYGYDKDDRICINTENKPYPCWRLFDSVSGEIIWQPSVKLSLSDYDATLSPDGKWLAIFVMLPPDQYGYIVSVQTNEAIRIFDRVVNAVTSGR